MPNNTDDFVDKIIITQMEKEIKALGNNKCYEVIERLAEAIKGLDICIILFWQVAKCRSRI